MSGGEFEDDDGDLFIDDIVIFTLLTVRCLWFPEILLKYAVTAFSTKHGNEHDQAYL